MSPSRSGSRWPTPPCPPRVAVGETDDAAVHPGEARSQSPRPVARSSVSLMCPPRSRRGRASTVARRLSSPQTRSSGRSESTTHERGLPGPRPPGASWCSPHPAAGHQTERVAPVGSARTMTTIGEEPAYPMLDSPVHRHGCGPCPETPSPTTSTGPAGNDREPGTGRLCSCMTTGSSQAADAGTAGV